MVQIEIPLCRYLRRLVNFGIPLLGLLVLLSPVELAYRIVLAGALLVWPQIFWRHYLDRRPISVQSNPEGDIECLLADGEHLPVARLRIGAIGPRLIAARLWAEEGAGVDLLVSSAAVSDDAHWRLRRMLLAWHQAPRSQDACD